MTARQHTRQHARTAHSWANCNIHITGVQCTKQCTKRCTKHCTKLRNIATTTNETYFCGDVPASARQRRLLPCKRRTRQRLGPFMRTCAHAHTRMRIPAVSDMRYIHVSETQKFELVPNIDCFLIFVRPKSAQIGGLGNNKAPLPADCQAACERLWDLNQAFWQLVRSKNVFKRRNTKNERSPSVPSFDARK